MHSNFNRLFGNNDTKRRLTEAIKNSTLPHALLIAGPNGSGKHTLALEIAAAANCEEATVSGSLPCGRCNCCKRIYDGNFPDVTLLGRSSGKATIGVEELRDFREDMFLSSTESRFKFYIIEEADLMTPAAQNALLKVLEEPPASVHILLLCNETDSILSTIKSRTQYIQMELFATDELRRFVTSLSDTAESLDEHNPARLTRILLSSGGVIGEALNMLDEKRIEEIETERKTVIDFLSSIPKKAPFSKVYAAVNAMPQKRDELRSLLETIRTALRDMIAFRVSENIAPIFFLSAEEVEEAVGSISTKRLVAIYDIISSALLDLYRNVLIAPLLTDIAVKIKEV